MSEILSTSEISEADKARLSVHFHFSPHGTEEDFEKGRKLMRAGDFDIFAPELPFLDDEGKKTFLKIVKGDTKTYQIVSDGHKKMGVPLSPTVSMFFASRKPIIFPEVSYEESVRLGIPDLVTATPGHEFPDYASALTQHRGDIHIHANSALDRERIVAERLPAMALELANAHPRLREKEEIRVLATIGIRHTPLFKSLRDDGFNVTRSFNGSPVIHTYFDQAVREVMFYGDVSDDTLKKSTWFQIAWPGIRQEISANGNMLDTMRFMRSVPEAMDEEMAQRMLELYRDRQAEEYLDLADALLARIGQNES